MNKAEIKIQNMLLAWLASQKNPVKHGKIRDVCNNCVFSVTGEKDAYCLYTYFYPLVRAGFIECGFNDAHKLVWQLSKPMVFLQDGDNERYWIGINLTERQKEIIANDKNLEKVVSETLEEYVNISRWTSSREYTGEGLPIIYNPSPLVLLKSHPMCSPKIFAKKESFEIKKCKQIYSPYNQKWVSVDFGATIQEGLYRVSEEVYSRNYYYWREETYSLNDVVNNSFWAKIQHRIDHNIPIAKYNENNQTLDFYIEPSFIIGRILFINQMFDKFQINSVTYHNVSKILLKELQRIFNSQIEEGDKPL